MTATQTFSPRKQRGPKAILAPKPITYEQYLRMPETKRRYEIVDGEMTISPAPSDRHQLAIGDLFDALLCHVRHGNHGFVLLAPLDVVIRKSPRLRVRQPDIAFWSAERVGGTTRKIFVAAREAGLAPDLVVEILSPEETRRRLTSKLADYTEIGVREVWLVGEQLEAIEVLVLTDGTYQRVGLFGRGEKASSRVLTGFILDVDALFSDDL